MNYKNLYLDPIKRCQVCKSKDPRVKYHVVSNDPLHQKLLCPVCAPRAKNAS